MLVAQNGQMNVSTSHIALPAFSKHVFSPSRIGPNALLGYVTLRIFYTHPLSIRLVI